MTLSLALTGCAGFFVPVNSSSGSGTTTNTGDYVYVANANPSEASVAGFSIGSGTLSVVSGSPYSLTFIPTALAVTPNNAYLYVGGTTGLYAYAIGSGGALSLASNSGASIPVASIAISPDGKYLFALQSNVIIGTNVTPTAYSIAIDEYQITPSTGALTLVANPSYTTNSGAFTPQMVRVSPNGGYVVAALGSAGDIVFTLSSGALSSTVQVLAESTVSSDNAIAFDSTSSYLYVARSGSSSGLAAYALSTGGVATQVGSSLGAAGSQPSAVVLDPTGKFAYVANRGDGTLSGFSITAGSVPSPLVTSPYSSGSQATALGVDNSGKYLLVVSSGGSPDLDLYAFSASVNGGLNQQASATTGTDPTLPIAIAPTH